jgi:predicted RND superfamily exporter protein
MFDAIARIILRNRLTLLIVLVVLTVLMAYLATNVKLSYEAAKILPQSDSTYNEYLKFKKTFGEDGSVMVIGFESNNIFRLKTFSDWYDLSQEIKRTEGIQEVISAARCFHVVRNDAEHKLEFKPLLTQKTLFPGPGRQSPA